MSTDHQPGLGETAAPATTLDVKDSPAPSVGARTPGRAPRRRKDDHGSADRELEIRLTLLQQAGAAALVVNGTGGLERANDLGRSVLDGRLALAFTHRSGDSATGQPDASLLRAAIADAVTRGLASVVRLAGPGEGPTVFVDVSPVAREPSAPALVLLTLPDPETGRRAAAARLRLVFSLSAAEAEIAVALASGQDLVEIAAARSVKLSTVRTQIASLLAKTDTDRQPQLVALVARLAGSRL